MKPTSTRTRTRESGLGLVELMVVMLIIAIISAVSLMSVKGARTSGGRAEAIAAATRYSDAVERFQQEHGRRVPVIGQDTWPVANDGPVHRLTVGTGTPVVRKYMKGSIPEIMTKGPLTGITIVQAGGGCPGVPTDGGILAVRVGPVGDAPCGPALTSANQFSIGVAWHGEWVCAVGDVPSTRRC